MQSATSGAIMRTPHASALSCLPRGACRQLRRARRRASAATAAVHLVAVTAALVALALSLATVLDSGAKQVSVRLDHVLTASATR